jgi:AbrB family looped-hinge helix DNA binding protein
MPAATLSSKGQMVIPKSLREQLGLKPGDSVDFIIQDNGDVLIHPAAQDVQKLKGMLYRDGRKRVSIEEMSTVVKNRKRRV